MITRSKAKHNIEIVIEKLNMEMELEVNIDLMKPVKNGEKINDL